MAKTTEIRDPVHGFIPLDDWELDIVNHTAFQRLRRIRQLGLTDMVYPGAVHTRFEHSLGVMHVATQMFNAIVGRRASFLKSELGYSDGGLQRIRKILRIACLLHDIGHPPFSHAAESLFPLQCNGKRFSHEDYSAAIVRSCMSDVIDTHKMNDLGIKAEEIALFLEGSPSAGRILYWRSILSGQLDADRADYLLRDSHHAGVAYGHYDLSRILNTLSMAYWNDEPTIVVEDGGQYTAEALIVARYLMFTQVYYQHTRRAFDFHLEEALKCLFAHIAGTTHDSGIAPSTFPPPTSANNIETFLSWDDWKVAGMLSDGKGGYHGDVLISRRHHRRIFETSDIPGIEELERLEGFCERLDGMDIHVDTAEKSWYKFGQEDIFILRNPGDTDEKVVPLSQLSNVVAGLRAIGKKRVYVPWDRKAAALALVRRLSREGR